MKLNEEMVWNALQQQHPEYLSTVGLAATMGADMASVSSYMTQLHRKNLVERVRVSRISDSDARTVTKWHYRTVGSKWVHKPHVHMISRTSPKTPLVNADITRQHRAPPALVVRTELHELEHNKPPVAVPVDEVSEYKEFLEYQAFQKFLAMKRQHFSS